MQKIWILTLTVCLLIVSIGLLPVHGEAEIYDNVLRLHVLANSDSEADQALKLDVRDAILAVGNGLFDGVSSRAEAEAILKENLALFEEAAARTVADAGYSYPVRFALGEEEYPARTYGSLCFPSGSYLSLRVIIGEGEGQNWWCVLYPPLCMSAATVTQTDEDAFIAVGFTGDQYRVITETSQPTYRARFKILEVFEKMA